MILILLMLGQHSVAEEALDTQKDSEETEESQDWDVNHPPGEPITVALDLREGTWINLDVSPDGNTLVFDVLGDLYTMPVAGGEVHKLTSGMAWDMQPVFSPDGEWVAFTSDRGGGDNLWMIRIEGTDEKAISNESFRLLNSPVWSPDGQYVVGRKHFTSGRSLGAGELWLYHVDGGDGLQLTKKVSDQKDLGEPSFSPDGRFIYYSKDSSSGGSFQYNKDPNQQIYSIERLDRETGRIDRVTGGPGGAIRPTPSPDGTTLAFLKRIRGDTVMMLRDLDSGAERQLVSNLDHDMQETWAIHGVYPHFSWMPDGNSIVYWAKGKINRVYVNDSIVEEIPFHIEDEREIRQAVRFPVTVAPEQFDVSMVRGAEVSPDGTQVVYQALGKLWIKNVSSGIAERLTDEEGGFELDPSWSRDGKRIVYVAWSDEKLASINSISLRRGRIQKLDIGKGHYRSPVYSPDGQSIVYRRTTGGWLRSPLWSSDPGLYQYDIRADKSKLIHRNGRNPHFAQENERLYFTQKTDGQHSLMRLDIETREVLEIASTKMGTELWISPDGEWLAVQDGHKAYLMMRPSTGSSVTVSANSSSVPMTGVSEFSGRDLHFSDKAFYWTEGTQLQWVDRETAFQEEAEPQQLDLSFSQPSDLPKSSIAVVGARIITMSDQGVIEDGSILWRDNRIVAVGKQSEVSLPPETIVIDGAGMTIMPGLIDVHFHGSQGGDGIIPQQNWMNLSALSFGVTTIHDPSNNTQMVFSASELQRSGEILAPRIYSTGTILYGAKSPGATAKVDRLDDALEHLQRMKSVGAISVKSYNQPRRDQRQQVLEAGRQTGMMVVPEGGSLIMHNLTQIVDGHTGIEHAIPVAPLYEDVLQLWSQSDVGYTPTLGVAYGGLMGEHYWYGNTNVWENERLLAFVPQRVVDPASRRAKKIPIEEYHHIDIATSAKALRDRGVGVQVGAHGQREGLAAHWEMWMFEQGGMSALEALESGTVHGARYLGLDGDIGSLEPGKLADLIVLEENPLTDLHHSTSIRWTVLNGRVYDAATMNQTHPTVEKRSSLYFEGDGQQPTKTQTIDCGCSHQSN